MTKLTLLALFQEPLVALATTISSQPVLVLSLAFMALVAFIAHRALQVYERRP